MHALARDTELPRPRRSGRQDPAGPGTRQRHRYELGPVQGRPEGLFPPATGRPPVIVIPPLAAAPADRQPGQQERGPRGGGNAVDPDAPGGLPHGPIAGHLLLRAARAVARLGDRGARLAAQAPGDLRGAVLGPRLHVGLGDQRLDGLAEFLPGPLDIRGEGIGALRWGAAARGVLAHRWALSLICSTSAFTLSAAWVGIGGVAFFSELRPASAASPAITNSATPTISAASHGRSTPASAMITQAIRHPVP